MASRAPRDSPSFPLRLVLVAVVCIGGVQLLLLSSHASCVNLAHGDLLLGRSRAGRAPPSLSSLHWDGVGQGKKSVQGAREDGGAIIDGSSTRGERERTAPRAAELVGNLRLNTRARTLFGALEPLSTPVVHFTFGSGAMLDFLRNWLHYVEAAGLSPAVVGAADAQMFRACSDEGIAALGIAEGLDVWTYTRSTNVSTVVQSGGAEWKYYRHHKSSFLELGLVKVAFLWELVSLGYDVLISDLDVVWLSGGWERWMSYRVEGSSPLPEAAMLAMGDVLVSTDELDEEYDMHGRWERWPHGVGWGWRTDLNTGVVFFRSTNGSKAFLQAWRLAMLAKRDAENTNDQFIFCQMVREAGMEPVTTSDERLSAWRVSLAAHGLLRADVFEKITPSTRAVWISRQGFLQATPCLPERACAPVRFTLGTLPLRAFTGGHTYFMQRVADMAGHALPRLSPLTVHFTFQYSDTPDYPHGKRQRAREAGMWAVDPPEYFTQGRFVKIVGPLYSHAQRVAVERRFPEWSPQRHMALDAIQRAAIRDLFALATALDAALILPPLTCSCDRYWGFLENCRMPTAPRAMPLPYRCTQDSLFEIKYWNDLKVPFREADFLDNPRVPQEIRDAAVRVVVSDRPPEPQPGSAEARFTTIVRPGASMQDVGAAVLRANAHVRLVEIGVADLRRLCKWLGSTEANHKFNNIARYILHESARYCPLEDHHEAVANVPGWNWRNPFTAYNCTWGFSPPTDYPEPEDGLSPCTRGGNGLGGELGRFHDRPNSTTCARAMLCDYHVRSDGAPSIPLESASRCNLEGYQGVDYKEFGESVKKALAAMGGRCPYPDGVTPNSPRGEIAFE